MKRIDYIRAMTVEEMAEKIIELYFTDAYCKSECEECYTDIGCLPHNEKLCCIRWLESEVEHDA